MGTANRSSFHWRDGITFTRLEDGAVVLTVPDGESVGGVVEYEIPSAEWVSIVAAVGPEGDNAETYRHIQAFHEATRGD